MALAIVDALLPMLSCLKEDRKEASKIFVLIIAVVIVTAMFCIRWSIYLRDGKSALFPLISTFAKMKHEVFRNIAGFTFFWQRGFSRA